MLNPTKTLRCSLETHHHAIQPGDRERQALLFRRNALLHELYPNDRRSAYAAMAAQVSLADGITIEPVRADGVRVWWVRPRLAAASWTAASHGDRTG